MTTMTQQADRNEEGGWPDHDAMAEAMAPAWRIARELDDHAALDALERITDHEIETHGWDYCSPSALRQIGIEAHVTPAQLARNRARMQAVRAAELARTVPTRPSPRPPDRERWLLACEVEPRLAMAARREPGWHSPGAKDTSPSACDWYIACTMLEGGFEAQFVCDLIFWNRKLRREKKATAYYAVRTVAEAMAKVGAR